MVCSAGTFVKNDFISEDLHLHLATLQNAGHDLPHWLTPRLYIHSADPKDHRPWFNAIEDIAIQVNA